MSRGNVRQRGEAWQARVTAGIDPLTKKRTTITRTFHDRRNAERWVTEAQRAVDTGVTADPGRTTLGGFLVDTWLPHLPGRVKDSTARRYEQLIRIHILPELGTIPLAKCRAVHVQRAIDGMATGPRTKVHAYRAIHAALNHAVRLQLLATNPASAASPPRPERPTVQAPEREDVRLLLDTANGWLKAACVLAASTGLRRAEVLAMQWRNIDLDSGTAEVVQSLEQLGSVLKVTTPKTSRSRRTVGLPPSAISFLREWRKGQLERRLLLGDAWQALDLVIDYGDGRPVPPDTLSQAFRRHAARCGVRTTFHGLRRYFATETLRRGVHIKVVSEALGHSSVALTADVYQAVVPSMREAATAAIEASLSFERG